MIYTLTEGQQHALLYGLTQLGQNPEVLSALPDAEAEEIRGMAALLNSGVSVLSVSVDYVS